jgi:hypothetical protein
MGIYFNTYTANYYVSKSVLNFAVIFNYTSIIQTKTVTLSKTQAM